MDPSIRLMDYKFGKKEAISSSIDESNLNYSPSVSNERSIFCRSVPKNQLSFVDENDSEYKKRESKLNIEES